MITYVRTFRKLSLLALLVLLLPVVAACGGAPTAEAPTAVPAAAGTSVAAPAAATEAATAAPAAATEAAPAAATTEGAATSAATTAATTAAAPATAATDTSAQAAGGDKIKLTILTHWGAKEQKDVLEPIFQRYMQEHPNITIEHQTVDFGELLKRITTGRMGGVAPDIYHFYNLWLPEFAGSDLLAAPPADVDADIKAGYSQSTVEGLTYNGKVWGYPTEVNDYQLIYNKKLLKEAGVDKVPETWDELKAAATKATKKDANGKVTQAGFLLIKGWDSGVVHPWTSLLYSGGGKYISDDKTKVAFNDDVGVQTLQLEMDMIKSGAVDTGLGQPDFVAGKVAMTIMANWWGATLRTGVPGGIENIGVAPIPHSANGTSSTLQYSWAWGVDKNSKNANEAWKFLQWLNSPQGGKSSPMGDYLTTGLNAIPGRTSDQQAHADRLNDPFVKPFVDALKTARTEAIIPGAQEIKTSLQKQIEAAWFGQKSAKQALDTAADEANLILAEKGQQ